MEWVDKTSFNQLNKLFVISVAERDHETLLTDQNLLTLCRDSELYAVPTVPRFAPRVLVTDKHFVLKDLPFYEEARAADTKARQDRLDKREKKHQERTLRQAPGVGHPVASSTAHPLSKRSMFPHSLKRPWTYLRLLHFLQRLAPARLPLGITRTRSMSLLCLTLILSPKGKKKKIWPRD